MKRMEESMEKSASKEMTMKSNGDEGVGSDSTDMIEAPSLGTNDSSSMETDTCKDAKSTQDDDHKDQLELAKAEMSKAREENERLKQSLEKIVNDYQSFQVQFHDIFQQEEAKRSQEKVSSQEGEKAEGVHLSLGINSTDEPRKDENRKDNMSNEVKDDGKSNGLELGLDKKFKSDSTESMKNQNSGSTYEEQEEEEPTEIRPPSKVLKATRSIDDEVFQQSHLKKARVCVRARCETPTLNDGCQWRKYGQKIAKGNPCPRAYYRCTVSPTCPVRKHVQRCAEDMSILITTYEGNHNHPVPVSATAMASTTAAAVSMLQSRSSSSTLEPTLIGSTSATAPISISNHGINFAFSQYPYSSPQLFFPNSSISTSNLHPTITLDLTAPENKFSSYFPFSQRVSSSTHLNFSSYSSASASLYLNGFSVNKNQVGLITNARQPTQIQGHMNQPFMQMNGSPVALAAPSSQQSLTEAITKVMTAHPTLQSVLVAALTSVVDNGIGGRQNNHRNSDVVVSSDSDLNLGESLPMDSLSGYSLAQDGNAGSSSSFYDKSSSLNS